MSRKTTLSLNIFIYTCLLLGVSVKGINDVFDSSAFSSENNKLDIDSVVSSDMNTLTNEADDPNMKINNEVLISAVESANGDNMSTESNLIQYSKVTNDPVNDTDIESTKGTFSNKTADNDDDEEVFDYEYDYNDALNAYNWPELLPTLFVYSLTMVLGITGNALIIFTICRYRRMKSTTNVFLASLASADLLLITICIPVKLAKLFSYTWTLGFFMCKMIHYVQSVSAICSVLTLTAMSIERYYAIVHPMKAKYICTIRQARKIILATWTLSFLLAIPILFAQVHMPVGRDGEQFWCVKNWDDHILWRFHELYMLMLILVVPTVVMAVAYTSICWEVFNVMQRRHDMTGGHSVKRPAASCRGHENIPLKNSRRNNNGTTNSHHYSVRESLKKVNSTKAEDDNKTVKQVIKMLVAVVVLFVVCWGPMLIDNVLMAYGVLDYLRTDSTRHIGTAFHLMAYFNSCINPLVYGFMSKNFRESFSKALCPCCSRGREAKRTMSMSQTSQTRMTSVRYADTDS